MFVLAMKGPSAQKYDSYLMQSTLVEQRLNANLTQYIRHDLLIVYEKGFQSKESLCWKIILGMGILRKPCSRENIIQ